MNFLTAVKNDPERDRSVGLRVTGSEIGRMASGARRGEDLMTKAVQKITLSSSRDIPFDKLVLSQSNVRRIKAGVSVEELAEDIARRGLLQSLTDARYLWVVRPMKRRAARCCMISFRAMTVAGSKTLPCLIGW